MMLSSIYEVLSPLFRTVDIDDEYMPSGETRKLGRVVCRGIAIMEMNPVEGMIEIQNPY